MKKLLKRFHISFNEFATVFTYTAIAGALMFGVWYGANQVAIVPMSEFEMAIGTPSLEADADYLHGLKASGLK